MSFLSAQEPAGLTSASTEPVSALSDSANGTRGDDSSLPHGSPVSPSTTTSSSLPSSAKPTLKQSLTGAADSPPSSLVEHRVKTSVSPGNAPASTGNDPASTGPISASGSPSALSGLSGRTWQALCPPTTVWTSHKSWLPSWAQMSLFPPMDGQAQVWPLGRGDHVSGDSSTLNTSECPNAAVVSSLSDVLEAHVHPRFFLSPRAAAGILRRAEKRGRGLPESLQRSLEALAAQASVSQDDGRKTTPTSLPSDSGTAASSRADLEPQQVADEGMTLGQTEEELSSELWSITKASDPISAMDLAQPITKRNGDPGNIARGKMVRRLSPTECERLMGWPPGWTVL